ncbi:MAG: hypothetical protein LBG96_01725 [Tannerella sp.]|jgi:hypothetical protein|nr:hypothetical protein [Tannerella sp.]
MQQQTQNRKMTIRNRPLTPIEKLFADRIDIKAKCRVQEKKLNEDFEYIKDHTSYLLLSGISSLLFSSGGNKNKSEKQSVAHAGENQHSSNSAPLSLSDFLYVAKSMAPAVWDIIQPLIITWGINKAKSLLFGLFFKKKKISSEN